MSDAEATVKHAIFSGIVSNWHRKGDPEFAEIIKDAIFNELFEPCKVWAVKEYLQEKEIV